MFDPDISTRSINRAPPRGSLTGTVGLFPLWKTTLLPPSFYDRHLLPHLHCARRFPRIVFFISLSRFFPFEKWDWTAMAMGGGSG